MSGNPYADTYIKQVQSQIQDGKQRLQAAEILSAKLKKAGQSTLDIDTEIAKLKQQLAQLEEAFS